MMDDEEQAQRKRAAIVIGEVLDAISVDELEDRINLLQAEIVRIKNAITEKQGAQSAADALFS